MDNHNTNAAFAALADPTRRAVLEQLAAGPAPVKVLAKPHAMALPSFLRHIEVLERAGLVRTEKTGRSRIVTLVPEGFAPVGAWLEARRPSAAPLVERPEMVDGGGPADQAHPPEPREKARPRRLLPWALRR